MARILVVDDDPEFRVFLHDVLATAGHVLVDAESGEAALALMSAEVPDLVLLDARMTGLDGFETARRMRAVVGEDHLAVIILTAYGDRQSRLLALSVADDVMAKPIDVRELLRRVANVLHLRALRVAMSARNADLAGQLLFKDETGALLIHDLKGPLTAVLANVAYSLEALGTREPDVREALDDAAVAGDHLLNILGNLLDLYQMEAKEFVVVPAAFELEPWLSDLQACHRRRAAACGVELEVAVEHGVSVEADSDVLRRVVNNVLDNAFRYTPRGGRIELAARRSGREARVQLRIGNSGPPVPAGIRHRVFEKFMQAPGAAHSNFGLGLYFCRLAMAAQGGAIRIEEEALLPTVFVIDLPAASANHEQHA